ncbi:rna recognition motif [Stylonychia lemnae]|uniref:Rna recognition motif n=1 Tax=Stylonychia lemnae TaxID=5949 RepID=A0A078A7C4_STYLE|nr:rna recognition motif [Stylonychia lemnae]|eukprot:CDW78150.1 rna recognition motif [Stylonychia lemnae]
MSLNPLNAVNRDNNSSPNARKSPKAKVATANVVYPIDWKIISDEIMLIVDENIDQQNFKLQIQQIRQSKNRRKIADSITNMESNLPRIFELDPFIDKRKHKNGITKAVFSKNVERIICLDQQSDEIFMYDSHLNIDFKTKISGKANLDRGHVFDTVILDFDLSERDKRVGAVMRDYTICFWDYRELFKFESNVNYNLEEIQTKIWFLEHCNHWFTTDKLNNLFAWHLENVIPKPLR